MQLKPHMEGSSIYFVKLEQVPVLPCLLYHSFPAAARLYPISPPFSTHPFVFDPDSRVSACRIRWRYARSAVPPVCCGKGGKIHDFSTLSTVRRRPAVGRVGKSTALFHAFHSSLTLCCTKSGKVAFSLSGDPFFRKMVHWGQSLMYHFP